MRRPIISRKIVASRTTRLARSRSPIIPKFFETAAIIIVISCIVALFLASMTYMHKTLIPHLHFAGVTCIFVLLTYMGSYTLRKVFVSSLCLLFWSLVEVHSQTVYLSLNGATIPNHGYVISDIGFSDNTALLYHTNHPATFDLVGRRNSGGDWFAPDGIGVGGTGSISVPGFRRNRDPMVVRLLRNTATDPPAEGIYHCVIEDDTLTLQTVYVGLYNSGRGITVSYHEQSFFLTLRYCYRQSLFTLKQNFMFTHTLTGSTAGVYTCTVANNKPSSDSASYTVQGIYMYRYIIRESIDSLCRDDMDTPIAYSLYILIKKSTNFQVPTNVTAVQIGLTSIKVSWTPPTNATGYIISYTGGGSSDSVTVGDGSTDNYVFSGLMNGATYAISVIATSTANAAASESVVAVDVPLGISQCLRVQINHCIN